MTALSPAAQAAFAAWMKTRGHALTGTEYDWDDMEDAFGAGSRAAGDLRAAQEPLRTRLETALRAMCAVQPGDPDPGDRWGAGYDEAIGYAVEHVRAAMDDDLPCCDPREDSALGKLARERDEALDLLAEVLDAFGPTGSARVVRQYHRVAEWRGRLAGMRERAGLGAA